MNDAVNAENEWQRTAMGIEELRLFDCDRPASAKMMANLRHTGLRLVPCASIAQALVTEHGVQKLENAAVLPHDVIKERLSLPLHGLAQILIKTGEGFPGGIQMIQVADLQPLLGKVFHQGG